MSDFLLIPLDLIIKIFEYIDPQDILGLRQLNSEWHQFIDGEEISRFLLHNPSFTFRGKPLRHQFEMARYGSPGSYGTCMRHLSSRLRGLDGRGPVFAYFFKHPGDCMFCYGCNFLVLETRHAEEIQVREIKSGKLLHQICLKLFLGPTNYHRTLVDMRIRDSILSVVVIEEKSRSYSTRSPYTGTNFILFFTLQTDSVKLLLKVPRMRQDFGREVADCDYFYDFNETIAVICTVKDCKRDLYTFSINIWSLRTGELMMGEINCGPVKAISVGQGDEWSILQVSCPRSRYPYNSRPRCYVVTFYGYGEPSSPTSLAMLAFPHDRKWAEVHLPLIGCMDFEIFKSSCDSWGLIWRQPVQHTWKTKVFAFEKSTAKLTGGWVVLSHSKSCLGQHLYVNFSAEYIVIPHIRASLQQIPKLSYFSLRRGRKPNWDSRTCQSTGKASSDDMMQEYWVTCDETCEAFFPANDVPDIYPWHGCKARMEKLEIFGDEEFLLSRTGEAISVYTFDSCPNDMSFVQMETDC